MALPPRTLSDLRQGSSRCKGQQIPELFCPHTRLLSHLRSTQKATHGRLNRYRPMRVWEMGGRRTAHVWDLESGRAHGDMCCKSASGWREKPRAAWCRWWDLWRPRGLGAPPLKGKGGKKLKTVWWRMEEGLQRWAEALSVFFFFFNSCGCAESSWLCMAFSSCHECGATLWLRFSGFSVRWHLLSQSLDSRRKGFSNCIIQALEYRLSSCSTGA